MPDGSTAICYAEAQAESERLRPFYLEGFGHHYFHPERLNDPLKLKTPSRIFLDSMSDLMGHWVPDEQIEQVLDVCRRAYWHTFQLLTKNAPRLLKFNFPPNVWVGVSAPPSHMNGKALTFEQQCDFVVRAMSVLNDPKLAGRVRWMSAEPLSFPLAGRLWGCDGTLDWLVIGAASNGRKVYQPDPGDIDELLYWADMFGTRVFFKGNLRGNPAANPWREEFPAARS